MRAVQTFKVNAEQSDMHVCAVRVCARVCECASAIAKTTNLHNDISHPDRLTRARARSVDNDNYYIVHAR